MAYNYMVSCQVDKFKSVSAVLLCLALFSCGIQSPDQAKSELSKMGVEFSRDNFTKVVREDDRGKINLFLKAGIDPDTVMEDYQFGTIPILFPLISHDDIDNVELIIRSGADINQTYSSGYTPLIWAIENGEFAMIKLLLDSGVKTSSDKVDEVLRNARKRITRGDRVKLTIDQVEEIETRIKTE